MGAPSVSPGFIGAAAFDKNTLLSVAADDATTVLVDNANFLKKLALPTEVLHLGVFINSLVIHCISLTALIVFLLASVPCVCYCLVLTFFIMSISYG